MIWLIAACYWMRVGFDPGHLCGLRLLRPARSHAADDATAQAQAQCHSNSGDAPHDEHIRGWRRRNGRAVGHLAAVDARRDDGWQPRVTVGGCVAHEGVQRWRAALQRARIRRAFWLERHAVVGRGHEPFVLRKGAEFGGVQPASVRGDLRARDAIRARHLLSIGSASVSRRIFLWRHWLPRTAQ